MKEEDGAKSDEGKLEDKGNGNVIEGEVTSKKHDKV